MMAGLCLHANITDHSQAPNGVPDPHCNSCLIGNLRRLSGTLTINYSNLVQSTTHLLTVGAQTAAIDQYLRGITAPCCSTLIEGIPKSLASTNLKGHDKRSTLIEGITQSLAITNLKGHDSPLP